MTDSSSAASSAASRLLPREYQQNIANKIIEKGNTLVVLPTGLGKTLIGAIVIEHFLKQGKKCMFLAPTRPLVEQHVKRLNEYFSGLGYSILAVTGQTHVNDRKHLYGITDIIIATPQTIKNDLKRDNVLSHFSCIIVDECHRAIGQYAYTEVARAAKEHNLLILGLTASPGGKTEKIHEIMDALSIDHVEIRTEEEADVSKYVQPLKVEWIEVEITKEIKDAVAVISELMDQKIETLKLFHINISKQMARARLSQMYRILIERKNMAALGHFAIFYNAFHGAELLETEGPYAYDKFVERLIERKKRADWHLTRAMSMTKGKEHPKMNLLLKILNERKGKRIIIFAQYRDQVVHIVDVITAAGFTAKQFLGKGKDGSGSQKKQKETLEEFREGGFDILVASSIGEEGIDVPAADTAIFYEPVPSEIRSIQRRGRVGRVKGGEVIILVTKGTRDETFRYVSAAREHKMKKIIKKLSTGEIKRRPKTKKQDGDGEKSDPSKMDQSNITSFFRQD